ncbi:aldehyde dehydrogenase family protein [Mesorhizobium sp. CO1-1-4]|uniref:aldehyde dehydrogenase family protein n=1 Tax=Mesorhizobium sp. CO1-1-4 TaxID=2876633 RepID=UPI001CCD5678|nr:aldehyde dehydrogenase family protein [Mesorhizobium sp. CO1-1-4]MBZ9738327.1 aldehyde dehydrogenase family protein [Mesorhizobium sp. CO1-1-4]
MEHEFKLLIDGLLVSAPRTFPVINPATAVPFAVCPDASSDQVNAAVAAAKRAFPRWAALPVEERADWIEAICRGMENRASEFAALLTAEQGAPANNAAGEVHHAIETLRAFRDMRLETRVLRDGPTGKVIEHRTPLGVVAAIVPWNFPLVLLMNKLGPALITGNTVIVKPAATTPLTTLLLGEICADVFPAGVINILTGMHLGGSLSEHPDIAMVTLTGSTETGKAVMAAAAKSMKRVALELGGNDTVIVLDDVDVKHVASQVFSAAMSNAGQICVAPKRAYVPSAVYDEFCAEMARLAGELVVGDGGQQGTQMGPVQNKSQFERVLGLIEDSRQRGSIIAGGHALDREGYFIAPTIVRDLPDDAPLVREEQFGPVLPILRYDDIDDVVARANDSIYGLAGTIWARDVERAIEIAKRIDTGTVWINQHFAIEPTISMRGAKQSGLGAELGEEGLHAFTQAHVVNAIDYAEDGHRPRR